MLNYNSCFSGWVIHTNFCAINFSNSSNPTFIAFSFSSCFSNDSILELMVFFFESLYLESLLSKSLCVCKISDIGYERDKITIAIKDESMRIRNLDFPNLEALEQCIKTYGL